MYILNDFLLSKLAVDRDLNVYVASRGNDSVVVISPDGKRYRIVLGESNGIYKPLTIYFDKVKHNLVVGDRRIPIIYHHLSCDS
jgi:DNA-binding beta-propeller fold protein YncE